MRSHYYGTQLENIISISELITCFSRKYRKYYSHAGEKHAFYELILVLSGHMKITVSGIDYDVEEGQLMIIQSGAFHSVRDERGTSTESVILTFSAYPFPEISGLYSLSDEVREEYLNIFTEYPKCFNIITVDEARFEGGFAKNATRSFVRGIKPGMETRALILVKRLEKFILELIDSGSKVEKKEMEEISKYIVKILTVMEEHIKETITTEQLARMCNISVSLLEKEMHKRFGYGAIKYFNMLKMQKALELLVDGMSVRDVSEEMGFSSQSYFCTAFKRNYGFSPLQVKMKDMELKQTQIGTI